MKLDTELQMQPVSMTYGKLNTLVGYCGLRLCGGGHCQGCEDRGAELHRLIVWLADGYFAA